MRERTAAMLRLASVVLLPLAVGGVLAALGPFGTFGALAPGERVFFWCLTVCANWAITAAAVRWMRTRPPAMLRGHPLAVRLAAALVASVPATAVVVGAALLVDFDAGSLAMLYPQVLLVTVVLTLVIPPPAAPSAGLTGADSDPVASDPAPPDTAPPPPTGDRFAARLPPGLAGPVLCLGMEDHYLRVYAAGGEALILCRMEDAVRDLEGRGLRVHRSWWVAHDAVAGVERDGDRLWVQVAGGRRVPVSRTYRATLRSAGWLDG